MDSYHSRSPIGNSRFYVPIVNAVEFNKLDDLPIDPYLLGILLGDGGLSSPGTVFWAFHKNDSELLNHVTLPNGTAYSASKISRAVRLIGSIHRILRELHLVGTTSDTKFIPRRYLLASVEDRISLLQGLCDSDGRVI